MTPLVLNIPTIAVTGSSGKTVTREFIAAILKTKWKVLRNTSNYNLPHHTKQIAQKYKPSVQAIILELGMGKQGAGEKHCSYIQPNISVITNVGTAHYGNLGNSIQSTARFKSVLIKCMKPDGTLLINKDDENSKLLDTTTFNGEIVTVGINSKADYQAVNIKCLDNGTSFEVYLDNTKELFSIPTIGLHNVYNALFAIAICHRLKFSASKIRSGLQNYEIPIKRLNLIPLTNQNLLIDDTVNANPQSVKAAIDVLVEKGYGKKKIAVLGSMLELGEYSARGHTEVGQYLAGKKVDMIFTYGTAVKRVCRGAVDAGFPPEKIRHFLKRNDLHQELKKCIEPNSVILVKGSSKMKMSETVKYIKNHYMFSVVVNSNKDENSVCLNRATQRLMKIDPSKITLHFGALKKAFPIKTDDTLETGKVVVPPKFSKKISIPSLPYECYLEGNELFIGPVIGLLVYPMYFKDPSKQLPRFGNYDKIKGLIYLFRPNTVNRKNKTIKGYYYDPGNKTFLFGTFPYPSAVFNRIPIDAGRYQHFINNIGENVFNYPYVNTNKWTFWRQMSKIPEIKNHLPVTKIYTLNSLLEELNKRDTVYLKPTTMATGRGILHVRKSDEGYLLSDRFGNKYPIKSDEELALTLKSKLEQNRKYIIQQEIPFVNSQGNKIDFRAYIQKDYTKEWHFSGMEAEYAKALTGF